MKQTRYTIFFLLFSLFFAENFPPLSSSEASILQKKPPTSLSQEKLPLSKGTGNPSENSLSSSTTLTGKREENPEVSFDFLFDDKATATSSTPLPGEEEEKAVSTIVTESSEIAAESQPLEQEKEEHASSAPPTPLSPQENSESAPSRSTTPTEENDATSPTSSDPSISFEDTTENTQETASSKETLVVTPLLSEEELAHRHAAAEAEREKLKAQQTALAEEKAKEAEEREKKFNISLHKMQEWGIDTTSKGIGALARVNLWKDQYVQVAFYIGEKGIIGKGYVKEIKLGPLLVTGAGPDKKQGTADDGVYVGIEFGKEKQEIMLSGDVELLGTGIAVDIFLNTKGFSFTTILKVLGGIKVEVGAESVFEGEDMDFKLRGVGSVELKKTIQEAGEKIAKEVFEAAVRDIQEARKEVEKARKNVEKLRGEKAALEAQIKEKEEEAKRKIENMKKAFEPASKDLEKAQQEVAKLEKEITQMRETIKKERQGALNDINRAQEKVNSLYRQIQETRKAIKKERDSAVKDMQSAIDAVKSAEKKVDSLQHEINYHQNKINDASWYEAHIHVYHGAQLTALHAAKGVAYGVLWTARQVLEGIKKGIKIFPIDADPRIAGLFAAYEPATAALKVAKGAIEVFPIDADPRIVGLFTAYETARGVLKGVKATVDNMHYVIAAPLALPEGAEIAALGTAIAGIEASIGVAKASLYAAEGILIASAESMKGIGKAVEVTTNAVGEVLGVLFLIYKVGIHFSLKELTEGTLPALELGFDLFGKKHDVIIQASLSDIGAFIKKIGDAIVKALDPDADMETIEQYKAKKEKLKAEKEKKIIEAKNKAEDEKKRIEAERQKALAEAEKVKAEQQKQQQEIEEQKVKKLEGEFGTKGKEVTVENTSLAKDNSTYDPTAGIA